MQTTDKAQGAWEMEAASAGVFKDPREEQVECSVYHKTAKYGDVMPRKACMEDAIRNAERILQKIDERWPAE